MIGGATKNIYAVAAGIAKALDLGDNAIWYRHWAWWISGCRTI